MTEIYYTYKIDGHIQDYECDTLQEAQDEADSDYEELMQQDEHEDGDTCSEPIILLKVTLNGAGDEIITSTKSTVTYTHYHGDMAEHGIFN